MFKHIESSKYASKTFLKQILVFCCFCLTYVFFISRFEVTVNVNDAFYDSDSRRTLNYLNELESTLSGIRPLLFTVSVLRIASNVLSDYLIWTSFNLVCLLLFMFLLQKSLGIISKKLYFMSLIFVNFGTLVWLLVPDTFIVAMVLFTLSIVIYGNGSNSKCIVLSGVCAASFNLFLILPWTIAHLAIQRRNLIKCLLTLFGVILVTGSFIFLNMFLKFSSERQSPAASVQIISGHDLIDSANTSPLDVGTLDWLHSPFEGFCTNLLSFLASPWMPTYKYLIDQKASESQLFATAYLTLSLIFTVLAWFGLWSTREASPILFKFCISLEVACLFLFITFSIHPFLFAPLVMPSRYLGIISILKEINFLRFFLQIGFAVNTIIGTVLVFPK